MSSQDFAGLDWDAALTAGHTLAMVAELGMLAPEQRQWLYTEHSVWPLLEQPEVAHLRTEGPALVELSEHPYATLTALHERLTRSAQHGWLSSPLNISDLREHLGGALACRDLSGETLLIRSYARNVLPILQQRNDKAWHAWLFGPIAHWWLPTTSGWHRLEGVAHDSVPPYHPIELDQPLVDALGVDPHAQALVAELQCHAPQVFTSECHGERLNLAGQALAQARDAGLSRVQDQYFFALYNLLSGRPMNHSREWPAMLHRVEHEGEELAQVQLALDEHA